MLLAVFLFLSVFVAVGVWMMVSTGLRIAEGRRAAGWPHVTGTVLTAASEDHSHGEGKSREVTVTYAYAVAGRSYQGSRIHPTYGASSFEEAHGPLLETLRPGTRVRVYHHPDDPARSTLSVGFFSGSLAMVSGGALFAGAGLLFMLVFYFAMAGDWNYSRGVTVEGPADGRGGAAGDVPAASRSSRP